VIRPLSDFTPFDKPLRKLQAEDLRALRSVAEGWYVEYKSVVPDARSIAKSISAFSNTYGGWLFYGIEERDRRNCVAGNFPGIANDDLDGLLQRIRQAAAVSLNPTPHFEVNAVSGPDTELGLAVDRSVICIQVPRGQAAPYVHISGRIYRRVGDGSEPKPETDRFVLDQLWQRGREIKDEYADWLSRDLELSKGENERPFLRMFLVPDLWRDRDIWADLTTSRVREIMAATNDTEETFSITPFDSVHRTVSGYVCRQLGGNDPFSLSATWFLKPNLVSEVIIPLPLFDGVETWRIVSELDGYEHGERYAEVLRRMGHANPSIVDLNFVFGSLLGIMHIQSLLNREAGHEGSIFIKSELINVWRVNPFLDAESVIVHQEQHGVPMCLQGRFYAPPGKDPESFVEIPVIEDMDDVRQRKLWRAIMAFEAIAHAFGIETGSDTAGRSDTEMVLIHADLFGAAQRANIAQERRNERLGRRNATAD
jgi:hypothetical protein